MNIINLILETCQKYPQQIAIYDEKGSLMFETLGQEILNLGKTLSQKGIKEGMCVGVMGKNSREFIIAVFGALNTGAAVMPISNQLKKAEVENIIEKADLHFILEDNSGPKLDVNFENQPIKNENWRFAQIIDNQSIEFAKHIQNPAIIRFTSGTTGTSKGVIISHQSILERIEAANKLLNLDTKDTVVWVLQMAYHFVVSIILYLKFGASIALCKDFLGATILDYCNRFSGTLLYASPMHIRLLANDKSDTQMPTMQRVISTSTAISKAQCEAFERRFSIPVSQAYGIIEVGLPIINYQKSKEMPDAVGYALPDYEVEILDDNLNVLPHSEVGHLAMRGPGMFDGYLTPPTIRADILENDWFLTGDLASKDSTGLIKIEGRKKSMINVSGNKVFPEEVEHVLNQHPAIKLSRVKGFTHRFMGEMVMAEIILKLSGNVDSEAIIKFCRERLITYKVPQKIIFVKGLPMTDSGKLKRDQ